MSQQSLSTSCLVETLPQDPDALLTESQVVLLFNISARTLQSWRLRGGGPKFIKAGRAVRYRRRDLLDWVEQSTVENTSQSPDQ